MSKEFNATADSMNVAYVAQLARLALTPEEVELFQGQLDHILAHVDELRELDVDGIEPMAHTIDVVNVFRKDVTRPFGEHETIINNFPVSRQDQVIVPSIIE
ncbi:MAG: aspartyl-tRNA(Asn)/glutamyl-tRNA(Gln) amidotransferase subunit C [Kiritimatiellia bacterium]|jgi:aspartyl-tRNA(Asn)/glutamyl-tRNA(Gln) amidotransferase subunit C